VSLTQGSLFKADLQAAAMFRRGSVRHQGQQVGFQNASGTLAPRQFPFHQCAIFGQAVNEA
jgi:hypothetical protein